MVVSSAPTVLFFRVYREISLPLYAALVEQLCGSADLPFQLATVLEDIGQGFMRLAEQINGELMRRGVLDQEVDADLTVEAQIDAAMSRVAWRGISGPATDRWQGSTLSDAALQRAFRIALVMTQDLPIAGGP